MTQVNRSSLLNNAADALLIAQARENFPTTLSNSIAPTFEISPQFSTICKSNITSVTASLTLYTTPRDKDFYLTYAEIGYVKDAACDLSSTVIQITIGGAVYSLVCLHVLPATAEHDHLAVSFPYPVKLDRNSAISLIGAFTAGTTTKRGAFTGFILE